MLSAQRAAVYLELVRQAAGSRLIVATVYPPSDANWNGAYPYGAMAPYVDAFAPMVYWECTDPGTDAALDVARLSTLRPVHLIGQAFNFASDGGRTVSPSAAEIAEFLTTGQRVGALGASFWVWQEASPEEWAALADFSWRAPGPDRCRHGPLRRPGAESPATWCSRLRPPASKTRTRMRTPMESSGGQAK